jgi:hypothetical protein
MSTAILVPTLTFKSWLANGTPNAFGTLAVYAAGTTTPIATYTDNTGGTPNANPLTLNARGEASVFLLPNVAYKFSEADAAGNPIKTTDQVTQAQLLSLYGGTDTGAANAYILAYSAPYTGYQDGIAIYWTPSFTNTTASTVNVSFDGGLSYEGSRNIINQNGSALVAGQLVAGQIAFIIYQSGNFVLTTPFGAGGNVSVAGVNVTGTSIPTNGIYLPAANTLGAATNGILHEKMDATGQKQLWEPNFGVAGFANAATTGSGTFTGTLTDCTTAPTVTVHWSRVGNVVTLDFPAVQATSNSIAMTISGLPATLTPARAQSMPFGSLIDNGTNRIMGLVTVTGTTLSFALGVVSGTRYITDSGGFTNSGTKGIGSYTSVISYNLT